MSNKKYYPDVSHHNPVTDWAKVAKTAPFLIAKATQGVEFVDPTLDSFIKNCEKYKIPYWLYCYLNKGGEKAQAEHLIRTCRGKIGPHFVGYVLDAEAKNSVENCKEALNYVAALGYKTMIYTPYAQYSKYKDLAANRPKNCAWWEARYGKNDGVYRSTYPCHVGVDLHQFTDQGSYEGIEGKCDLSIISGFVRDEEWFCRPAAAVNSSVPATLPYRICIDAGHGSNTAGKRTPDGYREHWINVKTAYYLEMELAKCGFQVMRSAWNDTDSTDDEDIPIITRQKNVRNGTCTVSVSCHANASNSEGKWDDIGGCSVYIHEVKDKRQDSQKLAGLVQAEMLKGTKQKDLGVMTGNFGMCNATYMQCKAAILVEIGFMTNRFEAGLMKKSIFCMEQAEDICRGICKYFGVPYYRDVERALDEVRDDGVIDVPVPPKSESDVPDFIVGKSYTTAYNLVVRKGPGTGYAAKKHGELTVNGQLHDTDKNGSLDKGTAITCQEVRRTDVDEIWVRCPSGWIAGYYNGRAYLK